MKITQQAREKEKTYLEVSINRTSISVFYVFVFVCTFLYSELSLLDISIYWRMQKCMFFFTFMLLIITVSFTCSYKVVTARNMLILLYC